MANWELVDVDYEYCRLCQDYTVCNVYEAEIVCNCLKCKSMGARVVKAICGSCLGKWLKSRDIDDAD